MEQVCCQEQAAKLFHETELRWNRATQVVVVKGEKGQSCQGAKLRGESSGDSVACQGEKLEVYERTDRKKCIGKVIAVEMQVRELRNLQSPRKRGGAAQLVGREVNPRQLAQ